MLEPWSDTRQATESEATDRCHSLRQRTIPATPRQATSRATGNDISRLSGSGRALTAASDSFPTTTIQLEHVPVIVVDTVVDSDVASISAPAVNSELSPSTFQSVGVT